MALDLREPFLIHEEDLERLRRSAERMVAVDEDGPVWEYDAEWHARQRYAFIRAKVRAARDRLRLLARFHGQPTPRRMAVRLRGLFAFRGGVGAVAVVCPAPSSLPREGQLDYPST